MWDVVADATYDNVRPNGLPHQIAILTLAGPGRVHLKQNRHLLLKANTLVFLEGAAIRRYCCDEDAWCFWWFEFTPLSPLPYALGQVYTHNAGNSDHRDFAQCFTKLQHADYSVRAVASATFCMMLQRWLADARLQRERTPHRQIIESIIARIHHDVAGDWSGPRLAREAGLCESTFRAAFKQATGESPARFVRRARLQAAYQMCQQHIYTLASIAEQLNFSSPFHLSALFKKEFGVNPSDV